MRNRYTSIGGVARRYDANGNLIWDSARHYHYDARNRLAATTMQALTPRLHLPLMLCLQGDLTAAGSSLPASRTAAATTSLSAYDALNRRLSRQSGSETERYFYDGFRVIAERDGSDALGALYKGNLLMERSGQRSFYLRGVQGDVRGLSDEAGVVVERVDYEAFGRPLFRNGVFGSPRGNPNLWRGLRYDANDGLYVLGGQRYDPASGRNLQP